MTSSVNLFQRLPKEIILLVFSHLENDTLAHQMASISCCKLKFSGGNASIVEKILSQYPNADTVIFSDTNLLTNEFCHTIFIRKPNIKIDLSKIDEAPVLERVANHLYESNCCEAGVKFATRCIELKPDSWSAYGARMHCFMNLGKFEEAHKDVLKYLQLLPNSAPGYCSQGVILMYMKRYDEAIAAYNKAVELHALIPISGRNVSATVFQLYCNRAVAFAAVGRYHDSLQDFALALECKADEAVVYRQRAQVLKKLKRHAEALDDFSKALQLDPTSAQTWQFQAAVHFALGRYAEAAAGLQRAAELRPNDAKLHWERALALENACRIDDAFEEVERAIAMDPGGSGVHLVRYTRGRLLQKLSRHEEALQDLTQAASVRQTDIAVLYRRGSSLLHLGRADEAEKDFQLALRLQPKHQRDYNAHGHMLRRLGRYEESLKMFNIALEKVNDGCSDFAEYNSGRGHTYLALGKLDEALSDFNKCIAMEPSIAQHVRDRDAVLDRMQKRDAAIS